QMWDQNANAFVSLSHGGNSTNNFFNSSIYTDGNTRTPNLVNNTGMDISMFELNNSAKNFIKNSDTSTRFKYGTTQDTYIIPFIAMAIDAYIPEPERSEEHTSELQSRENLVCRLLLEKKKKHQYQTYITIK